MIQFLILSSFNITFLTLRTIDISASKLRILIILLLTLLIILFILNSYSFLTLSSDLLRSSETIIFSNISLFLLCFSTVFFIYSLHHSDDDNIELEKPSFFKSRKGRIKIGRIVKEGRKKRKFFLSLEDLGKHMFICGATGTGKSNFLQHLLMNLTKRYKIPFLLAEFKGEYHFFAEKNKELINNKTW